MKYTAVAFVFILLITVFFATEVKLSQNNTSPEVKSKIRGVSLVASPQPISKKDLEPIKKLHARWIAVMPYAFSQAGQPRVSFNYDHQWWGEQTKGVAQTIRYAQSLGLKVMIKPHVWVHGQGWTGDFTLNNEKQWKKWEHDYSAYITHFAHLADSLHVRMLCIGTEFREPARQRLKFWRTLIRKIRTFYNGKLTYAANWDNYQHIKFWGDLDYIGVDAYFPLSEQKTPRVSQLEQQWEPIKKRLAAFSTEQQKPILFTEFGYQSVDFTAAGHWKFERGERSVNTQGQANAYQALFRSLWQEHWFAGGFAWKWYSSPSRYHQNRKKGYTPQTKPAERAMRDWYRQKTH